MNTQQATRDTASLILDLAEELVQRCGFNGFSYADIAARIGITKASLHYHFPGKVDLGTSLVERYTIRFLSSLDEIGRDAPNAMDRLRAYSALYAKVLQQGRMCLCGMLASDYNTLPEPMRDAVRHFFEQNERWLTRVLREGRENGELDFHGSEEDRANLLVGALEGLMLVGRLQGAGHFETSADRLISGLDARAHRSG